MLARAKLISISVRQRRVDEQDYAPIHGWCQQELTARSMWSILADMNDMNRFAALWVCLLALGGIAACGIQCSTREPVAPESRAEEWRNQRVIMQSKANPAKWEALEVMAHDPGQYTRTELTPAQARRWMEDGGFRRVTNQEYNDRLDIAGGYKAAQLRRGATTGTALASR